jgi:hypothetical protein
MYNMDNQTNYTKIFYKPKNNNDMINQIRYLLKLHYNINYDNVDFKNGNMCDLRIENLTFKTQPIMT